MKKLITPKKEFSFCPLMTKCLLLESSWNFFYWTCKNNTISVIIFSVYSENKKGVSLVTVIVIRISR